MLWSRIFACLFLVALPAGCGSSGTAADDPGSPEESWLFAQSGENASLEPRGDGALLVLRGLSPVTVAFTDRPDRDSRSVDSAWFLARWDTLFEGDPPNAALVLTEDDERTIVVTVLAARYGGGAHDGYYVVAALDGGLAGLPLGADLGPASLFIDDVPSPDALDQGSASQGIEMTTTSVSTADVTVAYMGVSGNEPANFGNSIVVWEGGLVGWNEPPLATVSIEDNAPAGSLVVSDLSPGTTTYTLGYTLGPSSTAVASTVTIQPGAPEETQSTRVSLEAIGPTEILVEYALPAGANPRALGHWVGIWEGAAIDVGAGAPPLARSDVTSVTAQGTVALENVELLRGTVYVIGYFVGTDQTALAATITTVA